MSTYNSIISQNNSRLQSLIDTANNLPEAGSGGTTEIETCSVTINFTGSGDPRNAYISGIQLVDGAITPLYILDEDNNYTTGVTSPYIITNIIKDTALTFSISGSFLLGALKSEGCELVYRHPSSGTFSYKITDSVASITISNDY